MPVHTLLIDNYDSFTYNLYDLLARVNGRRPTVVRNDEPWSRGTLRGVDNIVVSPAPAGRTGPRTSASAVMPSGRASHSWGCVSGTRG